MCRRHLTKKADDLVVDAGTQIGFTVTASNSAVVGTGTAHSVVIDDVLPGGSGISWSIASGPQNCSIVTSQSVQTLHCTGVDLAPGQSEIIHIVSNTTFASCKAYVNTASLTTTNGASKQADATTTVQCPALKLDKTADASPVDAGAGIGFVITASNSAVAGTGTAHGVVIDDPLPSGPGISWSIVSGPANCSILTSQQTGLQTLQCTAVDLAPGGSESIHITSPTLFTSCATLSNTASVTAANHPKLTQEASIRVACAQLTLAKTADAATVDAGDSIGFTAHNSADAGTGTAHGVVLNDPLPGGAGISWTILSGPQNCSIQTSQQTGAQTLLCTATNLGAGAMFSVHVVSATTFAVARCFRTRRR